MKYSAVVLVEKGKLTLPDRAHFLRGVSRLKDGAYEMTIAPVQDTRSDVANRYYFGVVIEHMYQACDRQHTPDEIHDDMCDRFLKYRLIHIDPKTGEVTERFIAGRSSKLKVSAFFDFVEQVRAFAEDFFNITIPDADKDYKRHREQARAKARKESEAA